MKEYTFFYLNGDEVSTLVKKDGKALSDGRAEKRKRKDAENGLKRPKNGTKKKKRRNRRPRKEGKEAKTTTILESRYSCACRQFVNPRRERFRGQDVLVFDFEPNPEYKPKNMEERSGEGASRRDLG